MKKSGKFNPGPGALVTAAFIGPGTVTTCSLAGARFGYALLWGMVFSTLATIILQEMSGRLGIITRHGLGEALRKQFSSPLQRSIAVILVISAIAIGNAAFETGNILGTSLGLQSLFGSADIPMKVYISITGILAFILLFFGSYRLIEKVMIGLVILMSITFLTTAVIISHDLPAIIKGMFFPSVPGASIVTLVGLIGTTVVPYNLFLHASAVQERWKEKSDIPAARLDISVSVITGGLISTAIIVTSAAAFYGKGSTPVSGADLALQLEPLAGSWARFFIGTGLFAAGISSAITAPLAAGYALTGIMGWSRDLRSVRFRLTWIAIVLTGLLFSFLGFRPIEAIVFAQAANGILLPVIAIYLLRVMNSSKIMGDNRNNLLSNSAGLVVVIVCLGLGIWSLLHITGIF